jgi:signal transduction histidine kinase
LLFFLFLVPTSYLLSRSPHIEILTFFINDMVLFISILSTAGYLFFRLRFRLAIEEYSSRLRQINEIKFRDEEIRKKTEEALALQLPASIGRVARQVAHDIRSPLTALEVLSKDLLSLPEDSRTLLLSATSRIRSIAEDLLNPTFSTARAIPTTTIDLSQALRELITEKELRFRSYKERKIDIQFNNLAKSSLTHAAIPESEFKRVISNIVDNCADAFDEGQGQIIVSLSNHDRTLFVKIEDNGAGIPPEIIHKLGTPGATFGKKHGHGLGLSYVIARVKEWGGDTEISSILGEGTTVKLSIPLQAPGKISE